MTLEKSDKIIFMQENENPVNRANIHLVRFGGKNRRFYASAAAMLALILAPFGLYTALDRGNPVLSALFFAVIAGSMLLVVILS